MKTRVAFLSLAVAALLVGCAKPPQAELDAAKAALETAKAAQAETYAADALAEVQQAMTAAEAEIAAQAEKLAFLRKYDTASQLIADATAKAETARQAAIDGKAAAKAAAEEAVAAANTALTTAQDTLTSLNDCKKKPKDFASQVELLTGTLSGLATRVSELSGLVANEDFNGATQAAGALSSEIGTFQADLDNAKTKLGC
jgi:chromosome segregation ATPase